jgi:hypothetical protein
MESEKVSKKVSKKLSKFYSLVFLLSMIMIPLFSHAGVLEGKVIAIQGNMIELDVGSEKGVEVGDTGRIYFTVTLGGELKSIYLAKFKVISVSEKSCKSRILEKTSEIRVGHLVEVIVKEGEIEIRSEPSGAAVNVDGKEIGETPMVASRIQPGKHLIRIVKEGYQPYETEVEIRGADRSAIVTSLKNKMKEGYLVVRTEFEGAKGFINGQPADLSLLKDGQGLVPGKYRVRVEKEGYEVWEMDVMIKAGEFVEVQARLQETRTETIKGTQLQKCSIFINTHPAGAKIYVNGRHYGTSPKYIELTAGEHSIVLTKDHYEPVERKVTIQGGQTLFPPIDQNLEPTKRE